MKLTVMAGFRLVAQLTLSLRMRTKVSAKT